MKTSDFIAAFLEQQGLPCVFELVGGMITHLLDSLQRRERIPIISMHHEQAAAFAADAVGRISGTPGVALATSGPGATNLLTGVGSCYFDSSPAVFITGQVNCSEQKGSRPVRQLGFQETDIVSMAKIITKSAWAAKRADEVQGLLHQAFQLATSARPGPVLLDLPMDVQRHDLSPPAETSQVPPLSVPKGYPAFIEELFAALRTAQRPLILVGGGLRAARAVPLFRRVASRWGVPVVHSLMAADALPYGHPLRVGMLGTYGNRWANLAIGRADFLLILGSRLDIRQTGSDIASFKGERQIYHVDIDEAELNNRVQGCRTGIWHLAAFLREAEAAVSHLHYADYTPWLAEVDELRKTWPDTAELGDLPGINPNVFMHQLSGAMSQAAVYVTDVGQHQMWAAQSLEPGVDQLLLTSGGMGSMGFALPAGIGASFALPGRPIVVIAGDGGLQCNIQELQTVVRNHLPLKMVVINNGSLGMVRQFQQSYFDCRYTSTVWGYSAPYFSRVAEAYGIPSETVRQPGEVPAALARLARDPAAPGLLQVIIDITANAYPKIAFGQPMTEMEPLAVPVGMERPR